MMHEIPAIWRFFIITHMNINYKIYLCTSHEMTILPMCICVRQR